MSLTIKITSAALMATILTMPAMAERDFAVTGGVGTMGGTFEGQFRLSDRIQLRAGANYLAFDETIDVDDIDYDGELDFSGLGAFLDVHPFGNSVFISGGLYAGEKAIDLTASSTVPVEIGGVIFTPDEYGRLEGDVSFEDVSPFLGFGIDTTFSGDNRWGFNLVAGAAFYGSADINLQSVGGTLSDDPILQAELEAEILEIEQEIEDYELYPVLQLGLSYRF